MKNDERTEMDVATKIAMVVVVLGAVCGILMFIVYYALIDPQAKYKYVQLFNGLTGIVLGVDVVGAVAGLLLNHRFKRVLSRIAVTAIVMLVTVSVCICSAILMYKAKAYVDLLPEETHTHTYTSLSNDEVKWTSDYKEAIGEFTCTVCGATEKISTTNIETESTCTEIKYTAIFEYGGEQHTVKVTTVGNYHSYINNECVICNKHSTVSCYIENGVVTRCDTGLTYVNIPSRCDGVDVTSIADGAFKDCKALKTIKLPSTITSIGESAFENCISLTSIIIPDNVTIIEDGTFAFCISLASVTIGNNVTTIESNAFCYCVSLMSITIPYNIKNISSCAFSGCLKLVEIYNLSSLDITAGGAQGDGPIGAYAKDIYGIVGSVSEISKLTTTSEGYVFYEDSNTVYLMGYIGTLLELTLPDKYNGKTYEIYQGAFMFTALSSVTIPDSVTSIGDYAFMICTSLTSVTIPDSVTNIGLGAFYGCTSLADITIGSGVEGIDQQAFVGCGSITNVEVDKDNENYKSMDGDLYSKDGATFVMCLASQTNSSFAVPEGVTSIRDYAFYLCDFTSITLHSNLTDIGIGAFESCAKLTSITVPDSVTNVGDFAFYGCESLTYNEYGNAYYLGNDTNKYVVLVKAKSTNITSCTINENTKVIYYSALKDCSNLTSITIPDGVTSIGSSAFSGCTSLTSITIPDSVTSIDDYAFSLCSKLTYNEYGNAYYLGNDINKYVVLVKANSTNITSCTINENTKFIYTAAFSGCTSLKSITIPDSVTSIGNYAFSGCSSLTSITIPDSVTKIGDKAFYNCTSLTNVTIPDSVTSIGKYAFDKCTSLISVVFKDTSGWKCFENLFGSATYVSLLGTSLSGSDLSDTSTAATYLISTYCVYYWERS